MMEKTCKVSNVDGETLLVARPPPPYPPSISIWCQMTGYGPLLGATCLLYRILPVLYTTCTDRGQGDHLSIFAPCLELLGY